MNKCRDCTVRTVGCHSRCPSYKMFKEKLAQINKRKHEETIADLFSPRCERVGEGLRKLRRTGYE